MDGAMSGSGEGGIFLPMSGDDGLPPDQEGIPVHMDDVSMPNDPPPEDIEYAEADSASYTGGGIFNATVDGPPSDMSVHDPTPTFQPDMSPGPQPQAYIVGSNDPPPPIPQQMEQLPPAYWPPMQQAVGETHTPHANILGLIVIGVAGGGALGTYYGGAYGGIAGAAGAGALVNAYRAYHFAKSGTPEGSKEAKVSGTYALLSAAAAGAIWWKMVGTMRPNRPRRSKACKNPGGCDIRRSF